MASLHSANRQNIPSAVGLAGSDGCDMLNPENSVEKTKPKQINKHKIDPSLLEILVCPLTHSTLRYDSAKEELVSEKAALAFPIRNGIPIMLAEQARVIKKS